MSTETISGDGDQNRIPEHVLDELRSNGASDLFIEVVQVQTSEIPGCDRNSAREEILKYMDWASSSNKSVSDYLSYGGGFFQSLYDGSPGGADTNNQMILEHVRGGKSSRRSGVMSWFVFEESELGVMETSGAKRLEELVPELREAGEWTDDDTLLVNVNGLKSTALAANGKLPRRMGPDPPTDTSPKYSEEPGLKELHRRP